MSTIKVIIQVDKGIVSCIGMNWDADIEFVIVDIDVNADEPIIVSEPLQCDCICEYMHEMYEGESQTEEDKEIAEKLRKYGW